jgi:hypothetical protein
VTDFPCTTQKPRPDPAGLFCVNHMSTICQPYVNHMGAQHIDPLIHFLKGRVMVRAFGGDRKLDPLPPCLVVRCMYKRGRICNNIANAERVPRKSLVFISVPRNRVSCVTFLLEIYVLNSVQIGVQTIV